MIFEYSVQHALLDQQLLSSFFQAGCILTEHHVEATANVVFGRNRLAVFRKRQRVRSARCPDTTTAGKRKRFQSSLFADMRGNNLIHRHGVAVRIGIDGASRQENVGYPVASYPTTRWM